MARKSKAVLAHEARVASHAALPKQPEGAPSPAPDGFHWVQSSMNRAWVLERDGTEFAVSVSSENYWCS